MAGGTGAGDGEGCDGLAQHSGVAQRVESQPVQQQLDFVPRAFWLTPAVTVKTPCQARTKPSRRTTAIFTGRSIMACNWSFRINNPYVLCQMPGARETFLRSPSGVVTGA